jgi:hypothetical protein
MERRPKRRSGGAQVRLELRVPARHRYVGNSRAYSSCVDPPTLPPLVVSCGRACGVGQGGQTRHLPPVYGSDYEQPAPGLCTRHPRVLTVLQALKVLTVLPGHSRYSRYSRGTQGYTRRAGVRHRASNSRCVGTTASLTSTCDPVPVRSFGSVLLRTEGSPWPAAPNACMSGHGAHALGTGTRRYPKDPRARAPARTHTGARTHKHAR